MRVIALRTLREFWESDSKHADSKAPLQAWYHEAKCATWSSPAAVKAQYRNASILKDSRVVFNIGGNKYRLVVRINYAVEIVFVRFIGTHEQYDEIDAETI
jgi:mRNA interferase HigB